MKIITFYADCELPEQPRKNQEGFDWRGAIKLLAASAARHGYETLVVTDEKTQIDGPWLRVGDAGEGLMMWLLKAQAAAIAESDAPAIMVSPDTLIAKPLAFLLGDWDVTLLTRAKPKPIVNSVIAFRPSAALAEAWGNIVKRAETLSDESKAWGADIDAVVQELKIRPLESGTRHVRGLTVRCMPLDGKFVSIRNKAQASPKVPIWDFKGPRKAVMAECAELLA